jgi:hypothetical protein
MWRGVVAGLTLTYPQKTFTFIHFFSLPSPNELLVGTYREIINSFDSILMNVHQITIIVG